MSKQTKQGARLGAALALALLTGCSAAAREASPATREQAAATREQAPATREQTPATREQAAAEQTAGELTLPAFTNVRVDAVTTDVSFRYGSGYALHYELPEGELLEQAEVQDGTLLFCTESEPDSSLPHHGQLVITLPEDTELGEIRVYTSFGSLTFDGQANSLVYDTSSGDAEIGGVLADSLKVYTSFGSLRFTGQVASLNFESSKGGAQVTGKITDTLRMDTTTGPLTAALPDPTLMAETGGKLTVDGVEQAGRFSRQGGGCSARITSSRGDITITTRTQ